MQVIPAVDIAGGRVVRLTRGDFDAVTVYGTDPTATVRLMSVAPLVHVVDLDAARSGTGRVDWVRLAEVADIQASGGIRDLATLRRVLDSGARRAVVGTVAVEQPQLVAEMVAAVGPTRLVAAVDVAGEEARGHGWERPGRPWVEVVSALAEARVTTIMVTGIESDGGLGGPDLGLIESLRARWEGVLIASGGVGSLADIQALRTLGADAVVVGRALYEDRFTLSEALLAARDG